MRQPASWHQSGFDQLEVPVIVVGPDRHVAYANPAAHRLFGVAPGVLEGAGMDRLVVAERRGELRNIEDVLKGGSARRVRSALRREDGGRLEVTMSIEPCLDAGGRLEGATVQYEVIVGSGRMSGMPGARLQGLSGAPVSIGAPINTGIKSDSNPVVSETARPAAVQSGAFHTSGVGESELEARLVRLGAHLTWLEERLTQPSAGVSLDDPRERARALMVIAEARSQLRQAIEEARGAAARVRPLPAPPKLPTL